MRFWYISHIGKFFLNLNRQVLSLAIGLNFGMCL